MTNYCLIEEGAITYGPGLLPDSWRNISNLIALTDEELQPLGWLPFVPVSPPAHDPVLQGVLREVVIGETSVTETHTVLDFPTELAERRLLVAREEAVARVNTAAGESRAKYITVIPGQEATYQMKGAEADAANAILAAGGTIDPTNYPMINAEAEATGSTFEDTLALVTQTAAQWKQLAVQIEALRRGAIVSIGKATTSAELTAVVDGLVWP